MVVFPKSSNALVSDRKELYLAPDNRIININNIVEKNMSPVVSTDMWLFMYGSK